MKFLVFLGCLVLGYVLIRYSKWMMDISGIRFSFAENILGPGGTYSLIKLFGLGFIIFGLYYLFR